MCHFVLVFFSPFSIAITSLGEERANLSAFRTFVRFVLVWICRFPLPLGVWEGLRFVIVALPGLFSYLFFSYQVFSFKLSLAKKTLHSSYQAFHFALLWHAKNGFAANKTISYFKYKRPRNVSRNSTISFKLVFFFNKRFFIVTCRSSHTRRTVKLLIIIIIIIDLIYRG